MAASNRARLQRWDDILNDYNQADVQFHTCAMSDSDQRLMQAFVDQEPHALLSRELNG